MDRKAIESIDDNNDDSNDSNNSSADDKTYHFRKGSDLDGFESFGALFADGLFTDLAICCSGRVFRCHRVVMAASSAYIKNALSAFNAENSNNCNTIMILPQDIRVQDMEAILHFIYNGQVEVTRDAIESFLSSAKILHIKGLANIKLVYNNSNNQNKTNNQNNNQKNNKNSINSSVNNNQKSVNNENQNSQNFNNNCINNCNNNENNNNNTNSTTKRRNGIIGGIVGQSNRSPKLKTDLNFNHFVDNIPQNQSFHSSQPQTQELDSKTSPSTARRKQRLPAKTLPTNGFAESPKDTNGNTNNWITIEDEEEAQEEEEEEEVVEHEVDNHLDSNDVKNDIKSEDNQIENEVEKSGAEETNGAEDSVPAMPCLIQIDADPTTFPSFCSEANNKNTKRRRSSSMRLEAKKNCNSLVKMNRNSDPIKQMVRTSNRKLGFMSFHKKSSPTIWNSSNKWKCEICNKLYGNKQTLKEHMDYFHSNRAEQIFTCSICAKEYTWKKSLMKHYRDIHQITNTSLSQMVANNHKTEDSSDAPALEWVTQSQDNSSQSK